MNGRFLPAFFGLSVILFCSSRTICFSENNSFYLEDNLSLVSPLPKRSSFENEMRDSNRLAFSVEKPGKFVSNDGTPVIVEDKEGSNFDPTSYYIINRVGFSYSTKETVKPNSFLKYDLGYNLNLETGLKIDRWKIGLLLNYQYNEWDSSSHVHVDGSQQPLRGDSKSIGSLLNVGYFIPLNSVLKFSFAELELGFYGSIGYGWESMQGYYLNPISLDRQDIPQRDESNFAWLLGSELSWRMSEQIYLLLSYSYFSKDYIPSHNLDLGLEFGF